MRPGHASFETGNCLILYNPWGENFKKETHIFQSSHTSHASIQVHGSDTDPSDAAQLTLGLFRWQGDDKHGFPGSLQYRIGNTSEKGMGQKSLSMGTQHDDIAPFFLRGIQYLIWRMTSGDENLGNKFDARSANLSLHISAKFLYPCLDLWAHLLAFLTFDFLQHTHKSHLRWKGVNGM
jgi:hypothetical protein